MAFCSSLRANIHPTLRQQYSAYFARRTGRLLEGEDTERGIPRRMARDIASEKFTTVVMDMTVDAKHRFRALSSWERGAVVLFSLEGTNRADNGRATTTSAIEGSPICEQ
jgi:hypothetical protein